MKMLRDSKPIVYPTFQAQMDWRDGLDIGYNPYPFKSEYWYRYREAYTALAESERRSLNEIAAMGGEPTGE